MARIAKDSAAAHREEDGKLMLPSRVVSRPTFWLCASLFFLSFAFNVFHVAPADFFLNFQRDSEALVIGKIAQAREESLFASRHGLGRYLTDDADAFIPQTQKNGAPIKGVVGRPFIAYASEIGLQGFFAALLDRALFVIPPDNRLTFIRGITATLSALSVTAFIAAIYALTGRIVAIPVAIGLLTAPWFIALGNNLYYALYLWFLPPVAISVWLLRNPRGSIVQFIALALAAMLPKFIGAVGFGWAPVFGVLAITPLCLAYSRIGAREFFRLSGATLAAFLLAGTITFIALWIIIGDLDYLTMRFGYRAGTLPCIGYGVDGTCLREPQYQLGMASPLHVLSLYLYGDTRFVFGGFWQPLLIGAVGWGLLFLAPIHERFRSAARGLQIAFPVALAGPVCWHLVMTQHSLIHQHVNFWLWYMPAIPLGFACATVATAALIEAVHALRS